MTSFPYRFYSFTAFTIKIIHFRTMHVKSAKEKLGWLIGEGGAGERGDLLLWKLTGQLPILLIPCKRDPRRGVLQIHTGLFCAALRQGIRVGRPLKNFQFRPLYNVSHHSLIYSVLRYNPVFQIQATNSFKFFSVIRH